MNPEELEKLGKVVYAQSLTPYKKRKSKALVIGFDTEFDSDTNELLSIQLSHKGYTKFYDCRSSLITDWKGLEALVKAFLDSASVHYHNKTLTLVCYWSIAELQHFPLTPQGVQILENAKTYNVRVRMSNGRSLEIFDLFPFFLTSLAKVAESFRLRKLDFPTSQVKAETLDSEQFRAYAVNDAVLCEKIATEFRELIWQEYGVDILLTKTPANTAMSAYRANFIDEKLGQDWVEVRRMALLCSWGGNNQAFVRGEFHGDFEEWDAISMYPSAALKIGRLPVTGDWKRSQTLEENLEAQGGILIVDFEFPLSCQYPCLPVYAKGKLCYPTAGRSYCTSYEVRLARELGATLQFVKGFHYHEGNSSLATFIEGLMRLKGEATKSHDLPKRNMAKLLMNAIIGKFTQKRRVVPLEEWKRISKELDVPVNECMQIWGLPVNYRILLGSGFMPEWNTLILGYARAVMARGYHDYEALLGTTDSMIIKAPGVEEIEIDGIKFKREYRATRVCVLRTRLYSCSFRGERTKVAEHGLIGSKAEAEAWINQGVTGVEAVTYRVKRPVKLREAWRRGQPFGHFIESQRTSRLTWDGKRKLKPDGTTRPLITVGEMP